jgi:hypothetical protein
VSSVRLARTRPALAATVAVVATVAVAVAVLVVPSDAHAAHQVPWGLGGAVAVTAVPVTRCPRSEGAPAPHVRLPATVHTDVTSSLAAAVSVYADPDGSLAVLAPKGWSCTSLQATGGASTLEVYPRSTAAPPWGAVSTVARGIVASQSGGCLGCSLELACPLFHSAWLRYVATYRIACRRASTAQSVRPTGWPSAVLFDDPPGVSGAGRPSGGGLAAYGAMVFHEHGHVSRTWLETCTLPMDDHDLCVVSVRAFAADHE